MQWFPKIQIRQPSPPSPHEWIRLSSAIDVSRLKRVLSTQHWIHMNALCFWACKKNPEACWEMLQLGTKRLQRLTVQSTGFEVSWCGDKKQLGPPWGTVFFQTFHFQLQSKHSPWCSDLCRLSLHPERTSFPWNQRQTALVQFILYLGNFSPPSPFIITMTFIIVFVVVKLNSKKCTSVIINCGWSHWVVSFIAICPFCFLQQMNWKLCILLYHSLPD